MDIDRCLSNNHIFAEPKSSPSDITPSSSQLLSVHFIISLFFFVFWPLYCLFFNLRFLITLWYLQSCFTLYHVFSIQRLIHTNCPKYKYIQSNLYPLFILHCIYSQSINGIKLPVCLIFVNETLTLFVRHTHFYTCKKYIANVRTQLTTNIRLIGSIISNATTGHWHVSAK